MRTCEQCGADAVDARGICRNCGWDTQTKMYANDDDDAQSLGETRAADIPPGGYAASSAGLAPTRINPRSSYTPDTRSTAASGGAISGGGRFCGTCGARLEPGIAFCGQCGTPVSSSTASASAFGASGPRQSGQDQYHVGGWPDDDGNEMTEAIMPNFGRSTAGPGMGFGATPYHQSGYSASQPGVRSPSSQTTRLIAGVICLVGSIVSASIAIILVLTMK